MIKKYKIECVGYGGRCTIFEKGEEFHEEWTHRLQDGETGEDMALELEDDIDILDTAIEYIYGGYSDTYFNVYEIVDNIETLVHDSVRFSPFACRSAYADEEDSGDESILVVTHHVAEKGTFGDWYVECEGDIDLNMVTLSTVDTYAGEFIENLYHNGNLIDIDMELADSYHKYETAYLGVLSTQCHEKSDKFNCSKLIKELWENYLDSL